MNYTDNTYHFRQDSTFLYYFGINQASLAGVIDADSGEAMLFGDDYSVEMIVWTGVVPSIASLGADIGVTNVKPFASLQTVVSEALSSKRAIHFLNPYRSDILIRPAFTASSVSPFVRSKALSPSKMCLQAVRCTSLKAVPGLSMSTAAI